MERTIAVDPAGPRKIRWWCRPRSKETPCRAAPNAQRGVQLIQVAHAGDALGSQGLPRLGEGLDDEYFARREAFLEPPVEEGAAHLAAANQQKVAAESHPAHASPTVSMRAALRASSTERPPQTTICRAG
jgi:hypothetical protein